MTRSVALLIPAVALLAACATPAVTAFDDGVRLVFNRGNAYAAGGSLPAAIEDITAVTPPPAITPEALDVRSLVVRAVSREVDGDRAGAIADLRAAFAAEVDTDRRARIDRLLRTLEAAR